MAAAEECTKSKECKECKTPSRAALLAGAATKSASSSVQYKLTGMKGEACGTKVESALAAVAGASAEKVCHGSGCAVVNFDPAKTNKEAIQKAIKAAGFGVAGEQVTLSVSGMKCGGCSSGLEEAVETIEGCTDAHACHKSKSLTVLVDTSKTSQKKLEEKILSKGYKIGAVAAKK